MVSSVSPDSPSRHHSASRVVILVQTFVIFYLSLWILEEYLNNMYLREYVSGVFQTDGLILGILGTLLVLGSLSSLMLMRRRHGEKRFGAVSLDVTPAVPKIKLAAEAGTKASEASAKPSMDFHPVVAALKADMADRRLSFGSVLGSGSQRPTTVPAPGVEVQKASILEQLTPNRQPTITGPRPGQMGAPFPQPPFRDLRAQAPTGPRIEQAGVPLAQRTMPVLRPQEPSGSTVLQSSQAPTPQIPTNLTTVITGILPVQKKKDPSTTADEKPSASQ